MSTTSATRPTRAALVLVLLSLLVLVLLLVLLLAIVFVACLLARFSGPSAAAGVARQRHCQQSRIEFYLGQSTSLLDYLEQNGAHFIGRHQLVRRRRRQWLAQSTGKRNAS